MYTLVHTEKGYRVLKEKVMMLTGMQLRFLYDVSQNLVPDLDLVCAYFESLDQFHELITMGLITVRPHRVPGTGEKKLIQSDFLYVGVRASVFQAKLTGKGLTLITELEKNELFNECMVDMDTHMAETLLKRGSYGL
jgi:hypothetical protein